MTEEIMMMFNTINQIDNLENKPWYSTYCWFESRFLNDSDLSAKELNYLRKIYASIL